MYEMKYLSENIGKWMPGNSEVAVDSQHRLSGILDTINATIAHGPNTTEFYDEKLRKVISRIVIQEWFGGYKVSKEFPMLGIGNLAADIVSKKVDLVERNQAARDSHHHSDQDQHLKFGFLGCYDTAIGAMLACLGCFDDHEWPGFVSNITFELFSRSSSTLIVEAHDDLTLLDNMKVVKNRDASSVETLSQPRGIGRRPIENLTDAEKRSLDNYFVRILYNDRVMTIPG